MHLPDILLQTHVDQALAEDLGRRGDITSEFVFQGQQHAGLAIVSRENGVLAGIDLARLAFHRIDPTIRFTTLAADGCAIHAGQTLATVHGDIRSLLTAERTALNFLTHLSGIASMTAAAVAEVAATRARIMCSRKTLPGLRTLQKYAVRAGGGHNHRMGLDDAVLIKDNHIALAGSLSEAIRRAHAAAGEWIAVEVEVDTLAQLQEALDAGAKLILLDNMSTPELRQAVSLCQGRAHSQASGGIGFARLREVAETGVDSIALGYLTHSSRALDIGLDYVTEKAT